MPKIYYTRGAQGSGKTTICELFIQQRPHTILLSRDRFRAAVVGNRPWQVEFESIATFARLMAAGDALNSGWSIIMDQTCSERWEEQRILMLAKGFGIIPTRWDFWTPLGVCRGRNARRDKPVPDDAVIETYDKIQARRAEENDNPLGLLFPVIIDTNYPGYPREPFVPDYLFD
jgi:predicted kinase